MKSKFALTSVTAAFILTMVALFVTNCKKPTDGVNLILNTNLINTAVGISFIDAKTGEPVGYSDATKVTMSVGGADAEAIIDVMGTSDYKTENGFTNLAIDPDFTPSAANPIDFVVVASAPGYLTTSLPISIVKEGGYDITVSMIKIADPPAGVAAKTTTITTNSSGATTAPVTIASGVISTTGTEATVTIPAGTILKDANGNPLTGTLNTNFVYFGNLDDASINSFPGGLSARTDQGDKFFSTAGFVSLEITNSLGTHVKTFSSSIQVNVEVSTLTNRPDGSGGITQVKAGDQIPVWSYDVQSGSWISEMTAVVQDKGAGKLEVVVDVNHLSYWNLDWHYGNSCPNGATINVTGNLQSSGNWTAIITILSCGETGIIPS